MCRIAGIVNLKNMKIHEHLLISMCDSMKHGGPDDAGIYIDNNIALGNRRLSIIDLTPSGHQPMSNEEGNIWITYNGEIYNFYELRNELLKKGYSFKSRSDTEVIIKAYEVWGEKSFKKLYGMFAFCIYDKRKNLVYLVRDHAGIKPLYYSISEDYLIFSSETRAFRTFDKTWPENPSGKIYFLIFGHIPEPYTSLKNVYMLPKGSFLKLEPARHAFKIEKFNENNFTNTVEDEEKATALFLEVFKKAVKRHLISDAPLGVFLSGGLDSSIISIIASQFIEDNLLTLSVVFNEKDYSEEQFQEVVARSINSKHIKYLVTEKDFVEAMGDIFTAMDQPTIDGVNTYFISKCAKEAGLKAVLSGLGGDELFGGYPSFRHIKKMRFYKPYSFYNFFKYLPNYKLKKFSFLALPSPISYYLFFRGIFTLKETAQILNTDENEILSWLIQLLDNLSISESPSPPSLNFVSSLETNFYMQNQLLRDTDFMSMWHSVETRVPYLDREVMEYTFSINEKIKFNNLPKGFLLKVFRNILPREIVTRRKMGFIFPFQEWMKKNLNHFIDLIDNKDKSPVKKIINSFRTGNLHWSRFWSLVVLNNKF